MKSETKSKVVRACITEVIALIEYFILQLLIYLGAAPEGGVNSALSMLLTILVYMIAFTIFNHFKKYRLSMWVAICAFIFLCIFVFYSRNIVDVLSFVVLLLGLLASMTFLDEKIKNNGDSNVGSK